MSTPQNPNPGGAGSPAPTGAPPAGQPPQAPPTQAAAQPAPAAPQSAGEPQPQNFAELQAQLRTMNERMQASEARSAALEQTLQQRDAAAQERRFTDEVMGRSDENNVRWYGETKNHVTALQGMAKAFGEDSEQFRSYVAEQRRAAVAIRQSDVYRTHGTAAGGAANGSPEAKLQAYAEEYRKHDASLTAAQAAERAMNEHPEVYAEYRERNPQFSGGQRG